jgi:hypothetical protein
MAYTKISDVIVPAVFNPYFIEKTMEKANFYLGGIISNNPVLNKLADTGGTVINMPFFNDLSGDSEGLSDSTPLTVNKITTSQDKARLHMRGKAWGSNDLAKALSGADPMGAIGDLVSDYWAREMQKVVTNSLTGVIADNVANFSGDMVKSVYVDTATVANRVYLTADVFVDGQATFGDAFGGIVGIAMHSDTYWHLVKNDNISFERESMGDLIIERYRGLRVIVDDKLPKVAGTNAYKYTTYLFGAGAFGYGQGNAPVPTETDRDTLQGTDILINRTHFIIHPMGVKWNDASVAGTSPTFAEMATTSNWTRVYERKAVKIAAIIHN